MRGTRKPVPASVRSGIKHLRKLAFGHDFTINPNLPDRALKDLEAAEQWLREIGAVPK